MNRRHAGRHFRQATVSVEFAVIAPVFALVVMGVAEISNLLDIKTDLIIAAREGARLAAMDREGFESTGVFLT